MSREVKYIGMDVHKEAIVIAVLNSSGQLIMESIVETKASSLLQFIHGLQGELHVTWDEGTVSRLEHSLCGNPGLCSALSPGMVRQDRAGGGAPAGRAALSTVGWTAGLATNAAPRVTGGEPET